MSERSARHPVKPLRVVLRIFTTVAVISVLLVLGTIIGFFLSNRTNGSLISSGETRRYLLYVPDSYNPSTPVPLVISIHGYASWPANQRDVSRWNELADREGFIVVYPSGTDLPKRWQSFPYQDNSLSRDVLFIADLIDTLDSKYNIDPARIYANGLSNGAGMSFLLGCQLSDRIAAIGGVAGAYLLPIEDCHPSRPVPMIAFHGTADPIVPFNGGPSRMFDIPFPNIPDWVDSRADLNGCDRTPLKLPAQGDVSGIRYFGCSNDAEVVFYTITGGGHTWPGGRPLPEFLTGPTNRNISATEIMWEFFQQHPLP